MATSQVEKGWSCDGVDSPIGGSTMRNDDRVNDSPKSCELGYVLITPARNEAATIEKTLQSVVAQTLRPKKWIIVSDGSTDATDEIVRRYAEENKWIDLIRMPERSDR